MTLKEARIKKELSIRQLASKVGVSRQTIIHYETDRCQPSDKIWKKLVKVLGLNGKDADKSKHFRARKARRLYNSRTKCKKRGCNRRAESRGYCHSHYVVYIWRREKG